MALKADNPLAGGTSLARAQFNSPGFQTGVTGWCLFQNGNFEANNALIRGSTTINGTTLIYNGAPGVNKLVYSVIAGTANTTDSFGNIVLAGAARYDFNGAVWTAVQELNGGILFYTAASETAGWTNIGSIGPKVSSSSMIALGGDFIMGTSNGFYLKAVDPATGDRESWHAVSTPAGMTGTLRVKLLPDDHLAVLDVNTVITSTNVAPTTYTAGSLPSAAYYPLAARQFAVSVNQQWSTTANASPRVAVPTSGAVTLPLPGFNSAGAACIVSGTVVYPLD